MERKSFYNKWNEENAREYLSKNNIETIYQLRKSNIALYQWINKHKLREKFFGEPARTKVKCNKWNEENAREFLIENDITTASQLKKIHIGLYQWINKQKLREKFFGEPARTKVTWSVEKIKQMIDENHIESMKELMEFDKNACDWVYRQGLVDMFFERYTPEKLQRRIETESNERGGRVYDFEKFKDEIEMFAAQENTRVIDQCWELHCITEYVNYKKEHPEYDQIKVS